MSDDQQHGTGAVCPASPESRSRLAAGDLVMQNYPEQEFHATVDRVYQRFGIWVADLTWHYPHADHAVTGTDLFSLVKVTRAQLDAAMKPIRVSAGDHRGRIVQAIVTRRAGQYRVVCLCEEGLLVCRSGRQTGWSATLDGARALWAWHVAGEIGVPPPPA